MSRSGLIAMIGCSALAAACSVQRIDRNEHDHGAPANGGASGTVSLQAASLPAGALNVAERLAKSPRHRELVTIRSGNDSVQAWVVHPQRRDNAPVVVVIHEIFGVSSWILGVADQLAAEGYIAIAPNLLTGTVNFQSDTTDARAFNAAINQAKSEDLHRRLTATAQYGMNLPSAVKKYGVVGFCWGGGTSFSHAMLAPTGLSAAVVYYGSPFGGSGSVGTDFTKITAPVLGLYGGNDNRINSTIPRADSIMKSLRKSYEYQIFDSAGHGFLRQQDAMKNLAATEKAWPLTIQFFKKHLGA